MRDVTAITVVCNTPEMFARMYDAFRTFHPDMPLIIIDNSDKGSESRNLISLYASEINAVIQFDKNIGHGRGLNFGIQQVKTKYILIMDSDTVILKDPLPEMIGLMDKDTYGVGCLTNVGRDGYDYGAFTKHKVPIKYLHPFFALINRKMFWEFKPFVHHGAPWYKTAVEMHDRNEVYRIKHFDGLRAFDRDEKGKLIPVTTDYVFHDFGGTRKKLRSMGRDEIEQAWNR